MFGLVSEKRLKELQREYDELKKRLDGCTTIEAKNLELRGGKQNV